MTETVALVSALIGMAMGSVLTLIAFGLGSMAGRRTPSPLTPEEARLMSIMADHENEKRGVA